MSPSPVTIPEILEDFDTITLTVGRVLTPAEVDQISGCLGYALRVHVAGEDLGDPSELLAAHQAMLDAQARYAQAVAAFRGQA